MSQFTDAWVELYDTQTEVTGIAHTAMVGPVLGRCVLGVDALNATLNLDSFTVDGTLDFQMLASDFDTIPTGQPDVQIAELKGLYAADITSNNGILYIKAANRTAGSK